MKRRSLILLLMAVVPVLSCTRPDTYEKFIRGNSGRYEFTLDMSDTTGRYEIDLYAKEDGLQRPSSFRATTLWTSPSERVYGGEVVFVAIPRAGDFYSDQMKARFGTGLRPVEAGKWKLEVELTPFKGLRGIGVVCKRKDGTR